MLSQFIHAARSLARDYAAHAATRIVKLDEARAVAGAGDPRRAITMLQLLRKQAPQDAAILEELAKTLIVSGDTQTAATVLLDALRTSPDTPALHHLMGSLLRQGVREALVADYWLLAFQLAAPTTPDAAIPLLTDRAGKAPLSAQSLLQLGHCLAACNQLPAATTQYQRALALEGITTRVLAALAGVYQLQGMTSDASRYRGMAHYQNSDYADAVAALDGIAIASGDTAAIEALAWSLIKTDNYQRAVDVCAAACASQPSAAELYRPWLWALRYLDRTSEAMAIAADAAARQQDPLFLLQERLLLLPPVFHSSVQLQQNYQRFLQGLTEFETLTAALDGEAARELLDSLSPNFELAYLGVDVSIPLQRFGRVLQRLAATAYPQWSALRHPDAANAQRRLRIGYVSAHFHIHSASLLAYGWLTSHTREQFEVFAYHVGDKRDVLTGRLAQECEHFVHVGNRLEAVCTQITNDQLDILIYVDIGMEMLTSIMASLRLAPLQCATWAHPIATGLPCIDVFISNELMEPPNGEHHYSEHLLRLPGIGACLQPPWLPPLTCTRQQFGLADDAIVYVSMQLIGKYLPAYDEIFAAIAKQVPHACFLFMEADSPELTDVLRQRLERAFTRAGCDASKHLRWLPRMEYDHYLQLVQLADVFLDPPGSWSAGITAIEAIACALPLVTLPGNFLRNRQAYGLLARLGATETVAADEEHYVALAARLGNDSEFRAHVRNGLQREKENLFNDTDGVQALEAFYRDRCSRPPA